MLENRRHRFSLFGERDDKVRYNVFGLFVDFYRVFLVFDNLDLTIKLCIVSVIDSVDRRYLILLMTYAF